MRMGAAGRVFPDTSFEGCHAFALLRRRAFAIPEDHASAKARKHGTRRFASGGALVLMLVLACAPARVASAASDAKDAPPPAIRLTNYADGETVRFPVPVLRGTLADAAQTAVTLVNTSSDRDTREMKGLAHKGKFKALAELVPGPNKLILRAGKDDLAFTLVYKPQTNSYFVRCVYLTDNTGDTAYQTPLKDDPQDYAGKLDTAMKIMQTFTAERNYDLGFGRRTFNLELDEMGKVKVHVFKQPEPAAVYCALNDQAWWGRVAGELAKSLPARHSKTVVIAAYTRFDPETRKVRGHTALGGGDMALFGSGNLFTWPSRLADVQPAFMDARRIDPKVSFDDSVGRSTFWGAASTTLGATLHELAHTFGLPHSREPLDILSRGFDYFNRVFTFEDPPSGRSARSVEFAEKDAACFAPVSAAALVPSRWFAMDEKTYGSRGETTARLDEASRMIVVESTQPICYIGFDRRGDAAYHVIPPEGSRKMELPLKDIAARVKASGFHLRIIDDQGGITHASIVAGAFVQTWQFAPITEPWTDPTAPVPLSDPRLKEIEASAAAAKPATSSAGFIDFTKQFPADKQADIAAYAFRAIKSSAARRVKILTGSDDALRVWLNGKLLKQVLALRAAQIDSESSTAELQPGENRLLVEVSQAGGGWGLYLRFEDADGTPLRLDDSGELVKVPLAP